MAIGASWARKSLDATPSQRKKTASERRAQRLRAEGRRLQHVLSALNEVHSHRGGQLTKFGIVLRDALMQLKEPSSQRGGHKQDAVDPSGSQYSEVLVDHIHKTTHTSDEAESGDDIEENLLGPLEVLAGDVQPPPVEASFAQSPSEINVSDSGSTNSSQAFVPRAHHSPELHYYRELFTASNSWDQGNTFSRSSGSDEDFDGSSDYDDYIGVTPSGQLSGPDFRGLVQHLQSLGDGNGQNLPPLSELI